MPQHAPGEQGAGEPDPARQAEEIAAVVRRAAAGDETAWETIVRLYGRRIYAMAKSRLRDADSAEEITQSVFATLAGTLRDGADSKYQESGKFEPWLFRIVMNRVRDEGRRRQRQAGTVLRLADADTIPQAPAAADQAHASTNDLESMRDAIQHLDDRDREIIELRHHGSLTFAQIAEALCEPMGTVLARHHRALKKLKQRLEADAPNSPTATSSGGIGHA